MFAVHRSVIQRLFSGLLLAALLSGLFWQSPVLRTAASSAGYALQFDGVNDYVLLPATIDVFGEGWQTTKTVALWVKPIGPGRNCSNSIPSWCDNIFGDRPRWWGISRGVINGQDRIWIWNYDGLPGNGGYNIIAIPYTPGEWVHIAMVHGNGTMRALKNGVLVQSVPAGATQQPSTGARPVLQIGAVINTTTRVWAFNGEIDEISLWNTNLSDAQVAQNMFAVLSGTEPNLRAYYRMSDGAGLTLTDDSAFNWNGSLKDGGGIVPPNGAPPLWVASGAFDGGAAATPTFTATATSEVFTNTPTPTATSEIPTDTPTPTATSEIPTDTPTPTATSEIPTDTPTPTPTETSLPPTETPTNTPEPPTATPTATATTAAGIGEVGFYLTPGDAWDAAVSGSYAYVADVIAGLRVVDVSNPSAPVEVGAYDTPGRAYAVALAGSYAYVADGRNGLQIIQITNPLAPAFVGTFDTPDFAWGIATDGTYAYVADRWGGVRVINVTNPAAPVGVAAITTPDQAINVALDGNTLYVSAYEGGGLLIYDVANPASPVLIGSYNTAGAAFGVAAGGGRVVVADGFAGVLMLDVTNPAAPVVLGGYNTPGLARDVVVDGSRIYAADESGFVVVDATNPAAMVEIGYVDTPGQARGAAYQNGYAYVADYAGGLRVVAVP